MEEECTSTVEVVGWVGGRELRGNDREVELVLGRL